MMHVIMIGILALCSIVSPGEVWGGGTHEGEERAGAAPAGQDARGRYLPFEEALFREAADRKRVYFFHATWCSNCRAADKALKAERDRIPSDVVVFRTNYDTERALKQRYAVTYQHTFVLVDDNGNQVRKWSGGDIDELIDNTQ